MYKTKIKNIKYLNKFAHKFVIILVDYAQNC